MNLFRRSSAKKVREDDLLRQLANVAATEAASDEFRASSAFVRAYGAALGITVPEHVTRVLFADKVKYFEKAWQTDYRKSLELAAYLSWMQCRAAFADVEEMSQSSDETHERCQTLMLVCGNTYPASDRVMAIMHDFADLLNNEDRQRDLVEQGSYIFLENPFLGAHQRAVAQILDMPWRMRDDVEPSTVLDAKMFLNSLYGEASVYFRRRAEEIFKAHVEHGVRPF